MTKISDQIALEFSKLTKFAVDNEYEVVSGDTLWGIAQKLQLTVEDIQQANPNLKPTEIKPGQVIIIPQTIEKAKPSAISTANHFEELIKRIASANQIPVEVFRGLVAYESSGNPQAVSNKEDPTQGAMGLTQLTPFARSALGITNPFDINQNLMGGAKWLKNSYEEAARLKNGDKDLWVYALMIYHAGMGAVQKWIDAGQPNEGFGNVGPKTIKYPKQVFLRGRDSKAFSLHWPIEK